MKFEDWNGEDLPGKWLVTKKVDGILMKVVDGKVVSKNGKPLHNLPDIMPKFEYAEVFCGSWGETWSIVGASKGKRRLVEAQEIFPLHPHIDRRLTFVFSPGGRAFIKNPSKEDINYWLKVAIRAGWEGIVLYNPESGRRVKVKPFQTVDVPILQTIMSTAPSHYNMVKEFVTPMGRVGTGLTKKQRAEFSKMDMTGKIIEVEITEVFPSGKWRNPRFMRLRPDK